MHTYLVSLTHSVSAFQDELIIIIRDENFIGAKIKNIRIKKS